MVLGLLVCAAVVSLPGGTCATLLGLALAVPFGFGMAIRGLAVFHAMAQGGHGHERCGLPPEPGGELELPRYAVLVPLYDEAAGIPSLLAALDALDYPRDRLDILLVVEVADRATQRAIRAETLPPHMRLVVVPDGSPRTKPRAINHALGETDGVYVVVFDAEDVPEPDQLRRALGVLRADRRVGCVQACLNTYNAETNWLTRQFTVEYTALFDHLLPALARFGFVVPLGGTSNHFPRRVLDELNGWDPYNVTEDADLGVRLARAGYRVATLSSTTWEEAPERFRTWLGQRTRWLKGWMQTWLVHSRSPRRLIRELGWKRGIGLQVMFTAFVVPPLAHPWAFLLLLSQLGAGPSAGPEAGWLDAALWWVSVTNIVGGYAAAAVLGAIAVRRRGWPQLAWHALMVPVYWLAVSLAAYRALAQLLSAPHFWEKTQHGAGTWRPGG